MYTPTSSYDSLPAELPANDEPQQVPSQSTNGHQPKIESMLRKKVFIALMGVTGAGKSSFIQKATGSSEVVVGHELTSCTSDVRHFTFEHEDTNIILIDTPGFDDTFKSETDVLKEIASWLEKTYRDADIKLSGIIYMHALEDRRMNGSSLRNLKMFRQLCGDQSMRNVIMVTSGWDKMRMAGDGALAETREEELRTRKEFWQPMLNKGARTDRFEFTKESALSIISKLIPDPPTVLQIQHELVEDKKSLVETAAGATVNEELAKLQAQYEEKIKKVHEEMSEALRDRDEEMKEILELERAKFVKMRDDARRAQDSLRYEQRNSRRRQDQVIEDLKAELANCMIAAKTQREKDQQKLIDAQAQRIADKMEFEQVVYQMRTHMTRLRTEERQAVEAEIQQAEREQAKDNTYFRGYNGDYYQEEEEDEDNEDDSAKRARRARRKKRAYKLCLNVVGIVGSVTMSALGLGFLNPFQGMIDFGGGDDAEA